MVLTFEFLDPDSIIGTGDFRFVEGFLKASGRSRIGWHYIVDLTWIFSRLKKCTRPLRVLDAGGGAGPTQFLLAELGHTVVNVDLFPASPLPWQQRRYGMATTTLPSWRPTNYIKHLEGVRADGPKTQLKRFATRYPWVRSLKSLGAKARHDNWRRRAGVYRCKVGSIERLVGNLTNLPEIESRSFDAVVSLSAIEHIPIEDLRTSIAELRRILKPSAIWAVTTSATERPQTWWHQPSQGHCFSETDLVEFFGAVSISTVSAQTVLKRYKTSCYLRENLAPFYKISGNNGMPWGDWKPAYIPCGISGNLGPENRELRQ